ncbi:MAG: TldD/PmbA family protein [Myxococcaceae bacterium]
MPTSYEQLAKKLVGRAMKLGATQAEAFIQRGRESSVRVRNGAIQDLTEAASKGVGVRVIVKGRLGFAYTSDFQPETLDSFVSRAITLAEAAAPNKLNGLPDRKDLKGRAEISDLFDKDVAELKPEWKIDSALEIEKAGKAYDPRITTFDSVGAGDYVAEVYLANSEGMTGGYSGTYVYLYANPVASENGQLQTSSWMDYKRFLNALESPEAVGREAARRAVRMLGAKKVKSQKVPVLFDPTMAAGFVGSIASAANGDSVFKKSSIFAPLLKKKVARETVTVVDDGLLPRGLGTSPFDGEGVPTRKTPIIENGVLQSFLYDAFTARKAKAKTTGNASRGYSSLPQIGVHNLYLEAGDRDPEEMVREVKNGFYVTSMLGRGANTVTGDYSRGANGLWIENGELAYPVMEVTVAGNLLQMLNGIDAIGSDLTFRGSVGAPTLRFEELTVAGA